MFNSEALTVNSKNHLEIGGCDCVELAKSYGTPVYVMDENLIRQNCRNYKDALSKYYGDNGMVLFASKAFCTTAMCRLAKEEGFGLDVVSGGELYTALKAGFPADRIYFHGNNKTFDEITMGIEKGVGRFVVDNIEELRTINELAVKAGKIIDISFRIKPGINAHTHSYIQTGQIDSKFGVALENGEAFEIIEEASKMQGINVKGLHCHIGSQIFEVSPFKIAARVMIDFIVRLGLEIGVNISELNLGGGFGIKYVDDDTPKEYQEYVKAVSEAVSDECEKHGIAPLRLLFEPGRSIVGPAGITLYTVGAVKNIKDIRTYVSVDGGMTDNPRYALYEAQYDAVLANKAAEERTKTVTVAGKCCESGDLIIKDIEMPEMEKGDILAVLATGAYNYSMSSNYNRIPKPPVIFVSEGKSRVVVKRETYDDIVRNDSDEGYK